MLEDYYVRPATVDRVRASWLAPQIKKYSSCTARIGVGFVLVNGALQVRLNSRSLAVAIFPVNKSQTALETHVVNSSRFVAFAQRRNVERCTNVLGWTTRTLHSRDKFDECLI